MNSKLKIAIIDDSRDWLNILERFLKSEGFDVLATEIPVEIFPYLRDGAIGLIITDLKMPGISGRELLQYTRDHHPEVPIIIMTGYGTTDVAVDSFRLGASDFLVKPFEKELLIEKVKQWLPEKSAFQHPARRVAEEFNFHGVKGKSGQMKNLIDWITKLRNTRVNVLIEGESGTGKEVIAKAIHAESERSKKAFVGVNCGAIPESLLESELFGYEKGAFTGAEQRRDGFFQSAEGGTIFLDEIGNASLAVQQRLLRVIQEREVVRVGGNKPEKIDVRILAATNESLLEKVKAGSFREDLFYRLNVVSFQIPPLRERPEDVPVLARHFIEHYAKEFHRDAPEFEPEVIDRLKHYSWPGNIRELENVIQRLLVFGSQVISVRDLPELLKHEIPEVSQSWKSLRAVEQEYIQKVLNYTNGNKSKAAEILGIDRKTLRSKLE